MSRKLKSELVTLIIGFTLFAIFPPLLIVVVVGNFIWIIIKGYHSGFASDEPGGDF